MSKRSQTEMISDINEAIRRIQKYTVWDVINDKIPELSEQLEQILEID